VTKVDDVAAAILERTGRISTFKLQKLVYYSQAWHLVWDDQCLFDEEIEAWANGPVCRHLYDQHKGRYLVDSWPSGNAKNLSDSEVTTIEAVLGSYNHLDGRQLSALTHEERPWVEAREGLQSGDRGVRVIDVDIMADYYLGLASDDSAIDIVELLDAEDSPNS